MRKLNYGGVVWSQPELSGVEMSIAVQSNEKTTFQSARILSTFSAPDWAWILVGCIASIEIANLILLGWSHGLYPVLRKPYLYAGDALFYQSIAQRALEGWVFTSDRLGFPFGSEIYDFPNSDAGNFLVFKLLGTLTGSSIAAANLHFLLSFAAVFAASFFVLRRFGIRQIYAASFALLFTFTVSAVFRPRP